MASCSEAQYWRDRRGGCGDMRSGCGIHYVCRLRVEVFPFTLETIVCKLLNRGCKKTRCTHRTALLSFSDAVWHNSPTPLVSDVARYNDVEPLLEK